ncbi:hypothetical protein ACFL6Q_01880 [Candidatus Neomarinimicrobiota bacterium]
MKRVFNGRIRRSLYYIGAVIFLTSTGASLHAQEVRQLKIGSLHNWYRTDASEPEHGFIEIQQAGLEWPAQYEKQDNQAAKGLWIGTTNYTDAEQYGGNTYPYKVVHVGPRGWDTEREFVPVELKMIGRFDHPLVYVDDIPGSELMWDDVTDEVDASLPAHRMINNVVNTSIGVTVTRKIMAWDHPRHDNYHITEYILKNTGNVDSDPDIEQPDKTLTDVYFFFQCRYAVGREGVSDPVTDLNSPRWGINEMLTTRGEAKEADSQDPFIYTGDYEDWLNGDPDADSMRCQVAWLGPHSGSSYDIIGGPIYMGGAGTGRLASAQFVGNITLFASKSPAEYDVDDPQQPTTTTYQQSDDPPTRPNDQFDGVRMEKEWEWITRGHRLPRHDEYVGDGFPDQLEGTPGGFSNMNGYGPYTLGPGESVRIVIGEGAAGLSREMCEDVGDTWIQGGSSFTLPDGSTTSSANEYKKAWVYTGMDSLFQTFGRARYNFNQGYDIATPPPPPGIFEIRSGGDRISLTWDNAAEESPGFAGYKIYRAIAKYDTTFDMIYACGDGTGNDLVNTYDDKSAVRGRSYFYYIASFDDGSNATGGVLESSMFWTRTTEPAYLRRPGGENLADIRVVPNPYNIRAKNSPYQWDQPDRIMFLNIPPICTIKIYTERGDLIYTIDHVDGTGDEAWESVTEYGQVVVSGLYIATFETPSGDLAIRKFIIIR